MNKKIISLSVALLLIVIAGLSATFAYFTDKDYVKNEFTVGNVKIDLTEGKWIRNDATGNIEADPNGGRLYEGTKVSTDDFSATQYGNLYPGMTIYKDPIVENVGSEDAYVAAKITVTDGEGDLLEIADIAPYAPYLEISKMVKGGLADEHVTLASSDNGVLKYTGDNVTVMQVASEGKWEIYIFVNEALAEGETATFFESLNIPATWSNDEMAQLVDFDIVVEAYATQTNGFADCVTAITTAFGWAL